MNSFKVVLSDCKAYRKYLCKRYKHHTSTILHKNTKMTTVETVLYNATVSAIAEELQTCNRIIYCMTHLGGHSYDTYTTFLRDDYNRDTRTA